MRARLVGLLLVCASLGRLASGAEAPARLYLKAGKTMEVTVLSRPTKALLKIRTDSLSQPVNIPIADIRAVVFTDIREDLRHAEQLCAAYRFAEAAAHLKVRLDPLRAMLDIPGNAPPMVLTWIRALYWTGAYPACRALCRDVISANPKGTSVAQAKAFDALCAIEKGDLDPKVVAAIPAAADAGLPVELYARARLQMAQRNWREARETAARLVVFHADDDEWMPAGLYVSAVLYRRFREDEVCRQIVEELTALYPGHPSAARAVSVAEDYPRPDVQDGDFESGLDAWTCSPAGHVGTVLPGADNQADNGGEAGTNHVLFVEASAGRKHPVTLSRRVAGFIPGEEYFLTLGECARAATGGDRLGPFLTVTVNDRPVIKTHLVKPVQGAGRFTRPYREVVSEPFVAQASELSLNILVEGGNGKESRTALIDNLGIYDWNTDRELEP